MTLINLSQLLKKVTKIPQQLLMAQRDPHKDNQGHRIHNYRRNREEKTLSKLDNSANNIQTSKKLMLVTQLMTTHE